MSPLSPEAQRLSEGLDRQFEAEDREIARQIARENREDRERAAKGLPPLKRKRDIRAFEGFASGGVTPR